MTMKANRISFFIQKYTMVLALVIVTAFFAIRTGGKTLFPGNINNLIAQAVWTVSARPRSRSRASPT